MWDLVVRFPFGPRAARDSTGDEESVGGGATPRVASEEGAHEHVNVNHPHDRTSPEPPTAVSGPPASLAETDLPHVDSHSLSILPANMRLRRPLEEPAPPHGGTEQALHKSEQPVNEPGTNVHMQTESDGRGRSQATRSHALLIRTEQTQMDVILTPIRGKLQHLKATTPERLPPYNSRMRANSLLQVLKMRLLPVGDFIMLFLAHTPEETRGLLEQKLWRHITAEYWPLPVADTTHLRVQEMYRNALYRRFSQRP